MDYGANMTIARVDGVLMTAQEVREQGVLKERVATIAFLKRHGYRSIADALERREHLLK